MKILLKGDIPKCLFLTFLNPGPPTIKLGFPIIFFKGPPVGNFNFDVF